MKKTIRSSTLSNRACLVLCVILALALLFMMFVGECRLAEIYECLSAGREDVRQHLVAEQRLRNQYNLASNYSNSTTAISGKAPIFMLFLAADSSLIQNAAPIMAQYGYTGAFLVGGSTPDAGLSHSGLKALTDAGWQTVLGGSGNVDLRQDSSAEAFGQYISSVRQQLSLRGLPAPASYYLEEPDISDACLEQLSKMGFHLVIQGYAEARQIDRYTGRWRYDMYFCGSATLRNVDSHIQLAVSEAGQRSGSMVVKTRRVTDSEADDSLDSSTERLHQCLTWFDEGSNRYNFEVSTPEGMYSDKHGDCHRLLELSAGYDTPEEYIAALKQSIEQSSRETADIIGKLHQSIPSPYQFEDFVRFVSSHTPGELIQLMRDRRAA